MASDTTTAAAATTDATSADAARTATRHENTGARTTEAASLIGGARERIDALDDRIIGLVQERMAISAVIQDARITSGGRRVNLSREMEILARYRDALGKPGTALAMTLLELSRGRV
ncbi:chorismate mutase [Streptomyces sp. NPDC088124]|uniref:chorismate mutase n=1 Tax=Streptomyces sp. NPDC088124 TaxID=3154654 RepID=UPI00344A5592